MIIVYFLIHVHGCAWQLLIKKSNDDDNDATS